MMASSAAVSEISQPPTQKISALSQARLSSAPLSARLNAPETNERVDPEVTFADPDSEPQTQNDRAPHEKAGSLKQLDPSLSKSFLLNATKATGSPRIVVGRYSTSQGLQVGYEAETGKRILFRSRFLPGGGGSVQILHLDSESGKIVHLVGKSKAVDASGNPVRDISVGGIDMRAFKETSRSNSAEHKEKEAQLKKFVGSDAGQALLDAVPALYATLESIEEDPAAAKLMEPFGAIAMALQLSAKEFRGFKHADKILDAATNKKLRDACAPTDICVFRGKRFMVHREGLFDALSGHRGIVGKKKSLNNDFLDSPSGLGVVLRPSSQALLQQLTQSDSAAAGFRRKDGNGSCDTINNANFGLCGFMDVFGLGGINPGQVWTRQCFGHDYCDCAYGVLACLISTPEGCGAAQNVQCFSLWDGVMSWVEAIWDCFWSWFNDDDDVEDAFYSGN